jgi:hypothetical protein
VSGVSVQHFHTLTPHMKLQEAGTVNILNVEHRTPNIERPILMTLRFTYFLKQANQAEDVI